MKLHLVNAPMIEGPGYERGDLGELAYPQLSLMYLAGYVRKKFPGVEIKITDGLRVGEQETLKKLKDFGAEVIGISCLTTNASGAYRISELIKRWSSKTLVILGGVHPTALPEETLKKSKCDLVVMGEGEIVLTEILEKCFSNRKKKSKLKEIRGVSYLENGKCKQNGARRPIMDLDTIPFPARDLAEIDKYIGWSMCKRRPETSFFSTRGCPFDCQFCANIVWKLKPPYLRLRSPEKIMDEVEALIRDFGIREYYDQADEINSSLDWLEAVCKEKIRRKIHIPWKAMLRADRMTRKIAKLLAESGLWFVNLGIESGNQETIDGIGKGITLKQVEDTCKLLKEQKISVCGLFMLFNVWEKDGKLGHEGVVETEKTIEFARSLLRRGLIQNVLFSQTTPYPGSEIYDTALKYNLIDKECIGEWGKWNHTWRLVMRLPGVSREEMWKLKSKALRIQVYHQIKTGNIPWRDVGFLAKRGLGVVKYLVKKGK